MRLLGLAALATMLLTGCGVPTGGGISQIDPDSLPTQLRASSAPPSNPSSDTSVHAASVYLATGNGLTGSRRAIAASTERAALQELLNDLTTGPNAEDRSRGLSSALPPAAVLTVTGLIGDGATIDLNVDQLPPDQTTAVAQIVLTATSVPGVDSVLLTLNGAQVDAPLTDGAQTDRPLTRQDYLSLVTATPRPTNS